MEKTSGFVYIWFDRKHHRFYVGSHWGSTSDGYVCSSTWMKQAYKRRPKDFKRRVLAEISTSRKDLLIEEQRWLSMIKDEEMSPRTPTPRYYNLMKRADHLWHTDPNALLSVGQKISKAQKQRFQDDPLLRERISEYTKIAMSRPDVREKVVAGLRRVGAEGKLSGMQGKKHSAEGKRKLSEAASLNIGKKNPRWKGTWTTPWGSFDTLKEAKTMCPLGWSIKPIRNKCLNPDRVNKDSKGIPKEWIGKESRSLGFGFVPNG